VRFIPPVGRQGTETGKVLLQEHVADCLNELWLFETLQDSTAVDLHTPVHSFESLCQPFDHGTCGSRVA
jgi:hypothetical protein